MEWLFKEDDYAVKKDENRFLDKSILTILNITSRISRVDTLSKAVFMNCVNPLVKVVVMLLFIILTSVTRNFTGLLCILVFSFLQIFFIDREAVKSVISLVVFSAIFTAIILIPSILSGNVLNCLLIIFKIVTTVNLANCVSYTTKWNDITRLLKFFHLPDIFILTVDIALRYIFILGSTSLDMLYALKLRSIGVNKKKYNSISKLAGSLFMKSKDMGDEMYSAMECRGYTGEYEAKIRLNFGKSDMMYIGMCLLTVIVYFAV